MPQASDILNALQKGETLTRRDIYSEFWCMNPTARISELRQDGWPIPPAIMIYPEKGNKYGEWSLCVAVMKKRNGKPLGCEFECDRDCESCRLK